MAATIVVADAVAADRAAFIEALKGTAYQVVAAVGDGDAALAAVEKHKPWCLAFDLLLPGHAGRPGDGGIATIKRVQQVFPGVRFLAIHNSQTMQIVMNALTAGAGSRVRKPFKRDSLLESLGKLGAGGDGSTQVKQAAVRLKKALPLTYKLASDGFFVKKREAITTDVSEAGIGLTTEEKMPKGTMLNVELDLSGEAPLKAKAQVARFEPITGMPRYNVGLVFIGLDPAERDRLKSFIVRALERGTAHIPKK